MRIWSIHPKYLDTKGLIALWREALLAKNVLEGRTVGYRNHPQIIRFREYNDPVEAINFYLGFVYDESVRRKFSFDVRKLSSTIGLIDLPVNQGQLLYEFHHLLDKLKIRDKKLFEELKDTRIIDPHPMFSVRAGDIEHWERV